MTTYNLQQWYRDSIGKKDFHLSTLVWNSIYPICKNKKKTMQTSNKYPKGTYFKIVKN